MSTLSFILATPKRVIPRTSPYYEDKLAPYALLKGDTSLVRHDISKEHDMAGINAHAVRGHGVLDLIDDGSSGRFDTQDLGHFHDVIRRRVFTHDA
jgi:hypothetical protein